MGRYTAYTGNQITPVAIPTQRIQLLIESSFDERGLGRITSFAIASLIVLNVIAIILESVDSLFAQFHDTFFHFEVFSVAVFSIEYVMRILRSPAAGANRRQALKARLRYMFSVSGVIDLIAILPFYLSVFVTIDLRFLRVLRLVRILKLTRYSPAMGLLIRAISRERQAIGAAVFLLAIALVVAACGIYVFERAAQPDAFASIPAAIWWAVATLTTVGYGDVTPITIGGKIFAAGVMIVGVGMVALPTGILVSTFADELRRRREAFIEGADSALADGILTTQELVALEALRERNGLSEEDAARILRHQAAKRAQRTGECPRCGYCL